MFTVMFWVPCPCPVLFPVGDPRSFFIFIFLEEASLMGWGGEPPRSQHLTKGSPHRVSTPEFSLHQGSRELSWDRIAKPPLGMVTSLPLTALLPAGMGLTAGDKTCGSAPEHGRGELLEGWSGAQCSYLSLFLGGNGVVTHSCHCGTSEWSPKGHSALSSAGRGEKLCGVGGTESHSVSMGTCGSRCCWGWVLCAWVLMCRGVRAHGCLRV